jgi:hypothetical protein
VPQWFAHPCLIHLQLTVASSRLRPYHLWLPSCSMPPLRSLLQPRVPPPVELVPDAPSPTRSALRPPCSCPRTAPGAAARLYNWLSPIPSCTRATHRRCCPRSCLRPHTPTAAVCHCHRPHHYAGTHTSHHHHRSRLLPSP